MLVAVPPALLLAALLILLGTQLAYTVAPRTPPYLIRLGLSAVAVLLGEGLGAIGVGARLALGDLHPVNDLVILAILQWASGWWAGRAEPV